MNAATPLAVFHPGHCHFAIVDDEPEIAEALAAWARSVDMQPVVCHRGETLLERLQLESGQLYWRNAHGELRRLRGAVIDLVMPGISGFELVRMLRTLAPSLPLVLVTALDVHERASHGPPPSGVAVLQKPFDLQALEDHLAHAWADESDSGWETPA